MHILGFRLQGQSTEPHVQRLQRSIQNVHEAAQVGSSEAFGAEHPACKGSTANDSGGAALRCAPAAADEHTAALAAAVAAAAIAKVLGAAPACSTKGRYL